MAELYPGEIKYVSCPVCGERVKLVVNRNWRWEGSCPQCHRKIIE